MKTLEIFSQDSEEKLGDFEITRVPELMRSHTESLYRSAFFSEEGKTNCYGPLTMTFAVILAKDLLLEGCDYSGLDIKIESAGRTLPAIPAQSELLKLLEAPDTFINVNGKVFKPNTEVYGFQQVYDDAAKCMDKLKQLGFGNDSMAIYATPDDITLEVNGSALGLEGNEELASRYYKLICHIGEIKEVGGKPQKTNVKTILLDTAVPTRKILLSGSIHPTLKRNKVGIGASHFSYGIAAFSDDCSKKHTVQECIQEALNWAKFNDRSLNPVAGIRELLDTLPTIALPDKSRTAAAISSSVNSASMLATLAPVTAKSYIGVFQPLKAEIEAADFKGIPAGVAAFSSSMDKTLGRGWSHGGLHLILGSRESGKSTMLVQQAILSENKMPVLYISFEQTIRDFVMNATSLTGGINKSEMMAGLSGTTPNAGQVKLAVGAAIDKLQTKLSPNLFFSGVEAGRTRFDADEIIQLAAMLPDAPNKLIIIESVSEEDFMGDAKNQLQKLKAVALAGNITVLISIHTNTPIAKRPNVIEDADIDLLNKYQRFSDTIINLTTEKTNMRKFVALIKGQIDPELVANLEQKAMQLCGGRKLKTDTYTLARFIHNRSGRRDMLLFLYQPDMGRFFDLASVGLSRP